MITKPTPMTNDEVRAACASVEPTAHIHADGTPEWINSTGLVQLITISDTDGADAPTEIPAVRLHIGELRFMLDMTADEAEALGDMLNAAADRLRDMNDPALDDDC